MVEGKEQVKKTWILTGEAAKKAVCRNVLTAPEGWAVTLGDATRTLDQNADQWPYLEAFSNQIEWPINGKLQKISAEDWKDILTCAFRNEQPRIAQGLDGGMVLLGQRTSKFGKKEFSEWLEFLHATAAQRGVRVYEDQP